MRDLEQEILIRACDLNPDPETFRSLFSSKVDEKKLMDEAVREGLAGFLYKGLLKTGSLVGLKPQVGEALESAYYRTVSSNLRLMQDLKEVLCEVNQRGIRTVLLQGMGLLHGTYEDIGLRPMTDVDLWVWREDYPAMVALLGRLGYERDRTYPSTFRKGATTFDLHTHILWAERIRAREKLLNVEEEEIQAKTRPIRVEGEEASCLHPCDQFLYLGLHLLKHRATRLMWLADLKSVVSEWEERDWKALAARARALGQEKTAAYMFFLLREIFGFPVPESMKDVTGVGAFEKKMLRPRIEGRALHPWAPACLYAWTKGPVRGLPIFLESLFPRPEILRQMFPEAHDLGVSRLYLKRAVQLAGMMRGK